MSAENWDKWLRELWEKLESVDVNPKTDRLEERFYIWEKGTPRSNVLKWFDQQYSGGLERLRLDTDGKKT